MSACHGFTDPSAFEVDRPEDLSRAQMARNELAKELQTLAHELQALKVFLEPLMPNEPSPGPREAKEPLEKCCAPNTAFLRAQTQVVSELTAAVTGLMSVLDV